MREVGDRRRDLTRVFPPEPETVMATIQPGHGPVGLGDHPGGLSLASPAKLPAHGGLVTIVPARLDQDPPHAAVAGLVPALVLAGYFLYFFRDPGRTPPTDANVVVAAADGTIAAITELSPAAFAGLAQRVEEEGRTVAYLSCSPTDDRFIMQIMDDSGTRGAEYVAAYADHDRGVDLLARAEAVIAERLHAAVIAAACGTSFVAVEYRPKVRDFAKSIDQEDYVVRSDAVTSAGLHQLLEPWVPGLEQLAGARRVRWSLDVDPLEVL